MSGHCEKHCSTKCQGSVSADMTWHMADAWVRWGPKRRCPFCEGAEAEREQVVKALQDRAAKHRAAVSEPTLPLRRWWDATRVADWLDQLAAEVQAGALRNEAPTPTRQKG